MKAARVVVLGVALAAGGVAALLARGHKTEEVKPAAPPLETVDVLVARYDLSRGKLIEAADIKWQPWPKVSTSPTFVKKSERPDAMDQFVGAIVRQPVAAGEPIRDPAVVFAKGSGFLAAVLPQGMRAVSMDISPQTGAGGFVLPEDHVDIVLTRRDREAEKNNGGVEAYISETILKNVRVLAVDQSVEEKSGEKVVVGKTVTVEVTPEQAETLALSRQLGTLSLALRSLLDSQSSIPEQPQVPKQEERISINTVRFGVSAPHKSP